MTKLVKLGKFLSGISCQASVTVFRQTLQSQNDTRQAETDRSLDVNEWLISKDNHQKQSSSLSDLNKDNFKQPSQNQLSAKVESHQAQVSSNVAKNTLKDTSHNSMENAGGKPPRNEVTRKPLPSSKGGR